MNLLSQLLPGVRELRTPVAVGSLWTLASLLAWQLWLADQPDKTTQVKAAVQGTILLIPPVAQASIACLGIYLLGIIMTYVGKVLSRAGLVLLAAAAIALFLYFAIAELLMALTWASFLAVLVLSLVVFVEWRTSGKTQPYHELLAERLSQGAALARPLIVEAGRRLTDALETGLTLVSPVREQINHFTQEQANRQVEASATLLKDLVRRVPRDNLLAAVMLLDIPVADVASKAGCDTTMQNWRDLRGCFSEDPQDQGERSRSRLDSHLRDAIYAATRDNQDKQRLFVRRFTNASAYQQDVASRLDQANVKLKADRPALYDEYDRLRAEGEFRSGVALPVAAVIALAAMIVAPSMTWIAERLWLVAFPAALLFLLLQVAGRSKSAEASRLLYSSIRHELIEHRDVRVLTAAGLGLTTPQPWYAEDARPPVTTTAGLATVSGASDRAVGEARKNVS